MNVTSLRDLCTTIRSKQAGPFRLTFDVVFKDDDIYQRVKASGALSRSLIAGLYQVPESEINHLVFYDPGRAVKITMIRPVVAGDPGDGDIYGCQQHAGSQRRAFRPLSGTEMPTVQPFWRHA
jgi:Domain of unknown function (DUF4387)